MQLQSYQGRERSNILNTILFQEYHVLSLLGSGSSSNVYLAEHIRLHHYRAIKCIPKTQHRLACPGREAALLKSLNHSGIPKIYEIQEDTEYYYIIEECVQGQSLSAFVRGRTDISQDTVISIGLQLCSIMEYLHGQRPQPVLYLDLKPEHLIVCGDQLKLIDFGIASLEYECEESKYDGQKAQDLNTDSKYGRGTPGFAAPEQYGDGSCGCRADIYGIGAVLYYMINGQPVPRKKPLRFPRYFSKQIKKMILKSLEPEQEKRYTSVAELRQELRRTKEDWTGYQPDLHLLHKIILVGSQPRVGVSHIGIALVSWMNRQGIRSLYQPVQAAGRDLIELAAYQQGVVKERGRYTYGYFRAMDADFPAGERKEAGILVQDYGSDLEAAAVDLTADRIILIVGSRPWEFEQGIRGCQFLSDTEDLIILCNYQDKQIAGKYAGISGQKVFSFPLDTDPFQITREKHLLFQEMMKEGRRRGSGSKA